MAAKFELIADEPGRYTFTLTGEQGQALLFGVSPDGRIAVQNYILHVRKAVKDAHHFVPHDAPDGAFVVLKDSNGDVLGKSPHVRKDLLPGLVDAIQAAAPGAPIIERRTRSQPAHH